MARPNCYDCKFRGNVAGSRHSNCAYDGNKTNVFDFLSSNNIENAQILDIKAVQHGVNKGWFNWPVDFDPNWLVNCNGFTAS